MSVFCRGWSNLVILVGSILKFSLLNVSIYTLENTGTASNLCSHDGIVNICMYFITLGVPENDVVVWGVYFLFFTYLYQSVLP